MRKRSTPGGLVGRCLLPPGLLELRCLSLYSGVARGASDVVLTRRAGNLPQVRSTELHQILGRGQRMPARKYVQYELGELALTRTGVC